MKKIHKLLLLSLMGFNALTAQNKSANIWCFGYNAEVDFNSGSPVSVNGSAMGTNEGSASISDRNTGSLLFYTDGSNVWNRNNTIMPSNTILLGGSSSSTQSAIIIPLPGNNQRYYIFTVQYEATGGVTYSIIDMTLNGGLGDVFQQPVALVSPTCEKITGAKNPNGTDFWMVTHLWNSDAFLAYPITAGGIGAPVISNAGVTYSGVTTGAIGYMKVAPDGSKIALVSDYGTHLVQVFNFDNSTGNVATEVLTDSTLLISSYGPYGVSFSPDSKLLYVTVEGSTNVYQYDLTLSSPAAVFASRNVVGLLTQQAGEIQIAPDGKIYIAKNGGSTLDGINNPNVYGAGCNLVQNAIPILFGHCALGLPDFIENTFVPDTLPLQINASGTNANCINPCSGIATATASQGYPPYTYLWNDGATTSADSNLCAGTFYVTVTDSMGTSVTDSVIINAPIAPMVNLGNDTSVCLPDTLTLDATLSGATYLWSTGATASSISAFQTNEYYVTVTLGACNSVDSMHLTENPKPPASVSANQTVFCSGDSAQICGNAGMTSYLWNTGETTMCITTLLAGNYYVTLTDANGCSAASNHLAITVHTPPSVSVSVNGDTLSSYNAVSYQWFLNGNVIPGAISQTYIATQGGSYTVEVTDTNGCGAFSTAVIINAIQNLNNDSELSIYPNPNSIGSWQLQVGKELVGSTLEVFDADGRLILILDIEHQTLNIELNVPRGIYLLRITSQKNNITRKLVRL